MVPAGRKNSSSGTDLRGVKYPHGNTSGETNRMREFYRFPSCRKFLILTAPSSQHLLWALENPAEICVPCCLSEPGPHCSCWGFLLCTHGEDSRGSRQWGTAKGVFLTLMTNEPLASKGLCLPWPGASTVNPAMEHGAQASPSSGSRVNKLPNHNANRKHFLGREKTCIKLPHS